MNWIFVTSALVCAALAGCALRGHPNARIAMACNRSKRQAD